MKLRRRDPHQVFIAQGYYSLKHDGSDQALKRFRTMATLNSLEKQSVTQRQHTRPTEHKRTHTIQNKESSFKKSYKKHQSTKLLTASNPVTNVNQFKHLTTVHYMDTAQINWAFGLRSYELTKSKTSISQVPSAYYKTTQSSKNNHKTIEIPSHINFNSFTHLATKGQHPSIGLLRFETTLREAESQERKKSPQLLEKQRSFVTIPVRDRNQYPKLLNSQSIKKKVINPEEDLQSAFDGLHNYPLYTDNIVKQKNYNNLREHIKSIPRNKINLPSLGWQTGLRSYGEQLKNSIVQKNKFSEKQQKR